MYIDIAMALCSAYSYFNAMPAASVHEVVERIEERSTQLYHSTLTPACPPPAAAAAATDDDDDDVYCSKSRFPFKRNRLRCVRCVIENRKKRKRLRWQAANHGCHCFDRAFLLAGACVFCVKISRNKRKRQPIVDQ